VENKVKKYICEKCGIVEWQGKLIRFHLDHINGNHTDNTVENLRLLCPNCHSQTDTYCRGSTRKKQLSTYNWCEQMCKLSKD